MGAPNLQQRLYLAKALNEDTDHLFDHTNLQDESQSISEAIESKIRKLKIADRKVRAASSSGRGSSTDLINKGIKIHKAHYTARLKKFAKERMKAGLDPRIPKSSREENPFSGYGRMPAVKRGTTPKSVLAYRKASAEKKAAALAAKGKK